LCTDFAFADPKDPSLRKLENSFLLGPVLVYARLVLPYFISNVDNTTIFCRYNCTGNMLAFLIFFFHADRIIGIAFSHQESE